MLPTPSTPRLAVIIPVYKVEPYLRECLDSVCAQTFADLRIILVDDGSPDSCGAICDEYAERDQRIRVIHQANRGLSGARNAGLALLEGCPYFTYLDSDDWLEPYIYRQCVELLDADEALDLVQFGFRKLGRDYQELQATADRVLSGQEKICKHFIRGMEDPIAPAVWNKVYRTSLCGSFRFREGYNWEDIAYTLEVLYRTRKLRLLSSIGLNYREEREGAITEQFRTSDVSPLFANIEYFLDQHREDITLVGYANALLVNQLWNYWSMLNTYPEAYRELTPRYLPFVERARRRPLPNVFLQPSMYRKRRLFLHLTKVYMGLRAWLRRRHHKH